MFYDGDHGGNCASTIRPEVFHGISHETKTKSGVKTTHYDITDKDASVCPQYGLQRYATDTRSGFRANHPPKTDLDTVSFFSSMPIKSAYKTCEEAKQHFHPEPNRMPPSRTQRGCKIVSTQAEHRH